MAAVPGNRAIPSIIMKRRNLVVWRVLRSFLREGWVDCGHWWFEIGDPHDPASESYGWWPKRWPAGWRVLGEVVFGLPGELNDGTLYPGQPANRDPHHGDGGDTIDEAFYAAVAASDSRTDAQVEADLKTFATTYTGKWRWFFGFGFAKNCQTFQKAAMRACRVKRGPDAPR